MTRLTHTSRADELQSTQLKDSRPNSSVPGMDLWDSSEMEGSGFDQFLN